MFYCLSGTLEQTRNVLKQNERMNKITFLKNK